VSVKFTVEASGPKIDAFLQKVIGSAGFELSYTIEPGDAAFSDFETPDIVVQFRGPDVDQLLENKAELLLALEHLTIEVLGMTSDEHSLLCFDANEHRALRIEELRMSALTAAEKVKKTRVPFHFSPMNSRERRIIHLALRNESAVRSESVGMAPHRQVVIVPADMKEMPAPKIPPAPRFGGGGGGGRDRGDRGGPGRPRGGGGPRGGGRDRGRDRGRRS
jgi:spoIIIJ-associated protein